MLAAVVAFMQEKNIEPIQGTGDREFQVTGPGWRGDPGQMKEPTPPPDIQKDIEAEYGTEEEPEEEELDDSEEVEELYAVTVNGEEHEVTFDELLRGYSRQSDYTRKTQELSNDRKQMEELQKQYNSEISTIQAERQQYTEYLNQIVENLSLIHI